MSEDLQPHGENLRRAVKWLSEQMQQGECHNRHLVEQASLRFDLTPMEEEFLLRHFSVSDKDTEGRG